ncbi:MAG: TPM domain-containing protein [Chitinophagales bacterium]|nr:TPM domain-containing protein [Chitinophagales bacterium]MDW8427228.1 TPM domain-containing protein [Chitinophagales bacterium]
MPHVVFWFLLLFTEFALAQPGWYPTAKDPLPKVPNRLVNDWAELLSSTEKERLEQKLTAFSDSTSIQMAILTIPTLNGYEKAQLAFRIGDHWGIGTKELDNGVLILVASREREVFIATGKGMEGLLPDVLVWRIINQTIIPAFRDQRYYDGLNEATDLIIQLTRGAFVQELKQQPYRLTFLDWTLIVIIVVMLLVLLWFFWIIRNYGGMRGHIDGRGWHDADIPPIIFGRGLPPLSGTGWNDLGRTVFGGFGGGSFGGGGAGGRW